MIDIKWDVFKSKRLDGYRVAFEDLSYHIFCRRFNIESGIQANFNHVGTETHPIYNAKSKKLTGFQSKFIETSPSNPKDGVSQFMKSLKNLVESKVKVDKVILYTNKKIQKGTKYETKIREYAESHNIEIEWFTDNNFTTVLNQHDYIDIGIYYFGDGDIVGFLRDSINPETSNILFSKDLLELPIQSEDLTDVDDLPQFLLKSSEKIALILGNPGSGKSIIASDLLYNFAGLKNNTSTESDSVKKLIEGINNYNALPVFIDLKDTYGTNLEDIIRNRLDEYKIKKVNTLNRIYILDGLDEVSPEKIDSLINFLNQLKNINSTKKIIITSRFSSINKIKVIEDIRKISVLEIRNLNIGHIEDYFQKRADKNKLTSFNKLRSDNESQLDDINDVYLVRELWEQILSIESESLIVNLLENKINNLLNSLKHRTRLNVLNLVEKKQDELWKLNIEISYTMFTKRSPILKLNELQEIIFKLFPKLNYKDCNELISYQFSVFARNISSFDKDTTFSYVHKRYQEIFAVYKLVKLFKEDKSILRKGIISDENYFKTIFLPFVSKLALSNSDFILASDYALLHTYMGYDSRGWGADDPYYLDIDYYRDLVNLFDPRILDDDYITKILEMDVDEAIVEKLIVQKDTDELAYIWNNTLNNAFKNINLLINSKEVEGNLKTKVEGILNIEKKVLRYISDLEEHEKQQFKYNPSLKNWNILSCLLEKSFDKDLYELLDIARERYPNKKISDFKNFPDFSDPIDHLLKPILRIIISRDLDPNDFKLDKIENQKLLEVILEFDYVGYLFNNSKLRKYVIDVFRQSKHPDFTKDSIYLVYLKTHLNIKVLKKERELGMQVLKENQDVLEYAHKIARIVELNYIVLSIGINTFNEEETYSYPYILADTSKMQGALLESNKSKEGNVLKYIRECTYGHPRLPKFNRDYLDKFYTDIWARIICTDQKNSIVYRELILQNLHFLNKLNLYLNIFNLDRNFYKTFLTINHIKELDISIEEWNDYITEYIERKIKVAILINDFAPNKSLDYLYEVINYGQIRHGWRKDTIVSYELTKAFDLVLKKGILNSKETNKLALEIYSLADRVTNIVDSHRSSSFGIINLIKVLAENDLEVAKEIFNKYKDEEDGYYIGLAREHILVEEVKRGIEHTKLVEQLEINFPLDTYNERDNGHNLNARFNIIVEMCKNNYYTYDEKVKLFKELHDHINNLTKDSSSGFLYDVDSQTQSMYLELCSSFNMKKNISKDLTSYFHIDKDNSPYIEISELEKVNNKDQLESFYSQLKNTRHSNVKDSKKFAETLYLKTVDIDGDVRLIFDLFETYYFPAIAHRRFTVAEDLFDDLFTEIIKNKTFEKDLIKYLLAKGGHDTYITLMRTYYDLGQEQNVLHTFRNFLSFCKFLTY